MDEARLTQLLEGVRSGTVPLELAVAELRRLPYADLSFARVDHHRELRQGFPEAIYGPGKTPRQCSAIVSEMLSGPGTGPVILTRASPDQVGAALACCPDGEAFGDPDTSRTVLWRPADSVLGTVLVATAGTADLPVATECLATLTGLGYEPDLLVDRGVAGLHRLLADLDSLESADAIVVVAGMEGALASVVGGLVACPVVAVPVSSGYGASLDGLTALASMLASCAAGLLVVGIDNGFGAAVAVQRILRNRNRIPRNSSRSAQRTSLGGAVSVEPTRADGASTNLPARPGSERRSWLSGASHDGAPA